MKTLARAKTGGNKTITTASILGAAAATALTFLLTAGLTSLILKGSVPEQSSGIYVFLIRSLSVLLGCLLATGIVKEKSLQTIGIVTAAYLVILLGIGIVLYNVSFHNFGIGLFSVLVGGGIACILKIIPQKKKYTLPKFRK